MADKTDKWMQLLTALGMMRGVAGTPESQIHTQEQVNPRVRSVLPRQQALNVLLAWMAFAGGIYLLSGGIEWLLQLDWDPRSYLAAWIGLLGVAGAVSAAVTRWVSTQVRIVQAFAWVLGFLIVVLAIGSLLLTTRERFDFWRLAGMFLGAGLILASLELMYNQSLDLINPYWRQSPLEREMTRQIFPAIRALLERADDDEVPVMDPRITYRRVVGQPVSQQEEEIDVRNDDEDRTEIDPEAGNLIWFVHFAAEMPGLSIADLTVRPAPQLPFLENGRGVRLRRAMIRRLLARGSTQERVIVDGHSEIGLGDNGWWHLRGQGATAEWAVEKDVALRDAAEMWREAMGDSPVPNYWSKEEYAALRAA